MVPTFASHGLSACSHSLTFLFDAFGENIPFVCDFGKMNGINDAQLTSTTFHHAFDQGVKVKLVS